MPKTECQFESIQGYHYLFTAKQVIFVSEFLDTMHVRIKCLQREEDSQVEKVSTLQTIIAQEITLFYFSYDGLDDGTQDYTNEGLPCTMRDLHTTMINCIRHEIRSSVRDLYSNFMEYFELLEEEEEKEEYSEGFNHVRRMIYEDLLKVFFVRKEG